LGATGDTNFRHCTVVTISKGDQVFFGGNDDFHNRDSYYWVDPGDERGYGAIWFGQPDNVQQGFNEKGLAYDANGLPKTTVKSHPGQIPGPRRYTSYPIRILRECATVEEVISWVEMHQWHSKMRDQLHFADADGDAVVISVGPGGEVAFTRKPEGDGFLVSTNFNLANPKIGSYPCWRYDRATEMLEKINRVEELRIEQVAAIMDAVHVEKPNSWTLYSVVADLRERLVYVYFWFQYDTPLVLSIGEEIASAPDGRPLSSLFPPEIVQQADKNYQTLMVRGTVCRIAAYIWIGLVAISLAILFLRVRPDRRARSVCLPMVAVLGPLGLIILLLVDNGRYRADARAPWLNRATPPRLWKIALLESFTDLPPYVVGVLVGFLILVLMPGLEQKKSLQLLVFYGLPLSLGLFLHRAPLLLRTAKQSYLSILGQTMPAAIIAVNLALTGLVAITLPLINWQLDRCGFGGVSALVWWPSAVPGALVSGLLLFVYHIWAVGHGFAAWSMVISGSAERGGGVSDKPHPTWRRLWLWILLSFVVLVVGMILGASAAAWISATG
jgi:hypothetical protein